MSTTAPRPASATPPPRWRRLLRRLWRFSVGTFALIGLFSVVHPLLFDLTPLISGSMSPTLQGDSHSGDWVFAEKVSYWFRNPRRWEVVEFNDQQGIQIMKRVVALPGETIAIHNNRAQVNGQEITPPTPTAQVKYYPYGNLSGGKTFTASDGYFVLGDDSIDSEDSRYEGPVTASRIRARAWFIAWPPSRMGWVR